MHVQTSALVLVMLVMMTTTRGMRTPKVLLVVLVISPHAPQGRQGAHEGPLLWQFIDDDEASIVSIMYRSVLNKCLPRFILRTPLSQPKIYQPCTQLSNTNASKVPYSPYNYAVDI